MSTPLLAAWQNIPHVIVGMLHALPLPGAPRFDGNLERVHARVLSDAEALVSGGVHALLLENFGDAPFYPDRAPASTVAHLTALASAVRQRFALPLGINVLRNDGCSALAVAQAVGASFIRVNVLCGARVTDQGVISGIAHDLLRERAALRAEHVRILADVNVKHAVALGAARPIEDELADTIKRGGADGVVISGAGTGKAANLDDVRRACAAAGETPVFIGSGVTAETAAAIAPLAAGSIVGSALKTDGRASSPVDPFRVRDLMSAVRRACSS